MKIHKLNFNLANPCHQRSLGSNPLNQKSANQTPYAEKNVHISPENYLTFKGIECNPGKFVMKGISNLECPCCGKIMLSKKQVDDFIYNTKEKKGIGLQYDLLKHYGFYGDKEKEIAEILMQDAMANPNLDLKELVQRRAEINLPELENEQKIILDKLREESKNLIKPAKTDMLKFLELNYRIIKSSDNQNHFQRKAFLAKLNDLKDKYKGREYKFEELIKIARKMPTSTSSKNAFFVKFARLKHEYIALRLIESSVITTEHIKPQSKEGENNTNNYIPLCRECNTERSSMPYSEWLKLHPEMPGNLQEFIDKTYLLIKNEQFKDAKSYVLYTDEIIKRFSDITYGELNLKAPDRYPHPEEAENLEKYSTEELKQKLETLEKRREELFSDEEFIKIRKFIIRKENLYNILKKKAKIEKLISDFEETLAALEHEISNTNNESELTALKDTLNMYGHETMYLRRDLGKITSAEHKENEAYFKNMQRIKFPYDIQNQILEKRNQISKIKVLLGNKKELEDKILPEEEILRLQELHDKLVIAGLKKQNSENVMRKIREIRETIKQNKLYKMEAETIERKLEEETRNTSIEELEEEISLLKKQQKQLNYKFRNVKIDENIRNIKQAIKKRSDS